VSAPRLQGVYKALNEDPTNEFCIAVFDTKDEARAFVNLQVAEREERMALQLDQKSRKLKPYEEPVNYTGEDEFWTIHSIAYNPQSTSDLYL
jgi:hypothetical protein